MANITITWTHDTDGTNAYSYDMSAANMDRIISYLRNGAYPNVDPITGVVTQSSKNLARKSVSRAFVLSMKDAAKKYDSDNAAATAIAGVADMPVTGDV